MGLPLYLGKALCHVSARTQRAGKALVLESSALPARCRRVKFDVCLWLSTLTCVACCRGDAVVAAASRLKANRMKAYRTSCTCTRNKSTSTPPSTTHPDSTALACQSRARVPHTSNVDEMS